MKWKTPVDPPKPNRGDERIRAKFALIPRRCEDGYTRWLETIQVVEIYREDSSGPMEAPEYFDAWFPKSYRGLVVS